MNVPLPFAQTHFLLSAATLQQCPTDSGAEVAFAGRSNAGKSSAINALTRQSKLARTSKTPGRTQLLNFFGLTPDTRLVDLPGYGYAKVPRAVKSQWDKQLEQYLQNRESLRGLVLVMDVRHPLQEYDWHMIEWSVNSQLPVHLLMTKADKLNQGPAKNALLAVRRALDREGLEGLVTVQLFSALKKTGLQELEGALTRWLLDDEAQPRQSEPQNDGVEG